MVDLVGNLVFLGGQALILAFLIYIWVWLFLNGEYLIFFLLTIFMAAGGYMGAREARAEMG
jgi:hypothetical protein